MSPSEWPQWLRDTIPVWAMVVVFVWFGVQRFLDRQPADDSPVMPPYKRPTRDPRIVCMMVGFIAVSAAQVLSGPAPDSVNNRWGYATNVIVAAVMAIGCALTLAGAFVKGEYQSIGLELAGSVLLAGACGVYLVAYVQTVTHWASVISVAFTGSLVLGNVLRAIQLIRRVQ